MTAAIAKRIETRLERLIQQGAGPTAGQALASAGRNLKTLEVACLKTLDARLTVLTAFRDQGTETRPADDTLRRLSKEADEALTACAALDMPLMAEALLMLSAQVDALKQTSRWPAGALDPAIDYVLLVRGGGLNDKAAEWLMKALGDCLDQYSGFEPDTDAIAGDRA